MKTEKQKSIETICQIMKHKKNKPKIKGLSQQESNSFNKDTMYLYPKGKKGWEIHSNVVFYGHIFQPTLIVYAKYLDKGKFSSSDRRLLKNLMKCTFKILPKFFKKIQTDKDYIKLYFDLNLDNDIENVKTSIEKWHGTNKWFS